MHSLFFGYFTQFAIDKIGDLKYYTVVVSIC